MDTMTVAAAAGGRVAELRTKINGLYRRKGEIELALQREPVAQEGAAAKRAELVQELPGGDDAMVGFVHAEIDGLDKTLRVASRVVEGLQQELSKIKNETEPLTAELNELQRDIQARERAEMLRVFQSKMEHAARVASDALANGRERLADLNRLAAQGIELYGDAGLRICGPIVEQFVLGESNLDAQGWRPAFPAYTRLEFWIRPMVRG